MGDNRGLGDAHDRRRGSDHSEDQAAATPPLEVSVVQPRPEVRVVVVGGEVDMVTARLLERWVREQLTRPPRHLVLDLSGVTFLDSSGLALLVVTRELAQAAGCVLHLVGDQPPVARPLTRTGLVVMFRPYSSLEHLLTELADG